MSSRHLTLEKYLAALYTKYFEIGKKILYLRFRNASNIFTHQNVVWYMQILHVLLSRGSESHQEE